MSLLSRCRFQTQWQQWRGRVAAGHWSDAPTVGFAGAASSAHRHASARLLHQSSSPLPSWRAIGGRPMSNVFLNNHSLIKPIQCQRNIDVVSSEHTSPSRWISSSRDGTPHHPRNNNSRKDNANRGPDMRNCQSIEEITVMAYEQLDNMAPKDTAAFWTLVSTFINNNRRRNSVNQSMRQQQQELFTVELNSIYSRTMDQMTSFRPRDLVSIALAFAKIVKEVDSRGKSPKKGSPQQIILRDLLIGQDSQQKELIFQSIATASLLILPKFDARGLSNLAYANAIVDLDPVFEGGNTLFHQIAGKSIPLLAKFETQSLSNMVWAYEKVGSESNPRLFREVGNTIVALDRLGKFSPQDLSNILLAFAKAKESNPKLFKKVAGHIVVHSNFVSFNTQRLADVLWAFAEAGESNPGLFEKVADHIHAVDSLRGFNPQNLSETVWAFAKADESNPIIFKKVADHIVGLDKLHSFKPKNLANTVWAFATAKKSHPRLFQKVADHIVALDNLHSFNGQDCSQLLWAFATADIIHSQLFDKVTAHADANIDFKTLDEDSRLNLSWLMKRLVKPRKNRRPLI